MCCMNLNCYSALEDRSGGVCLTCSSGAGGLPLGSSIPLENAYVRQNKVHIVFVVTSKGIHHD